MLVLVEKNQVQILYLSCINLFLNNKKLYFFYLKLTFINVIFFLFQSKY